MRTLSQAALRGNLSHPLLLQHVAAPRSFSRGHQRGPTSKNQSNSPTGTAGKSCIPWTTELSALARGQDSGASIPCLGAEFARTRRHQDLGSTAQRLFARGMPQATASPPQAPASLLGSDRKDLCWARQIWFGCALLCCDHFLPSFQVI